LAFVPAPLAENELPKLRRRRAAAGKPAGPEKIFEVPGFLWSAFPKAERSPVVIATDLS
jgi:hypothetical protein